MGGAAYIGEGGNVRKYKEFDNFCTKYEFTVDGLSFNSSEQFFQYQKCDDKKYQDKMLTIGRDPGVAWDLGNNCNLRKDWEEIKVDVMMRANLLKIRQNADLKNILINSVGPISFKRSCDFWNIMNAIILSSLRDNFRNEFKSIKHKKDTSI